MKFSELSDDSTALNLKYEKGIVSFSYDDRLSGKSYLVKIKCPRYRSCFFSIEPVGLEGCARVSVTKLKDLIDVDENGKYAIGKNNAWAVSSGAIIALGLKAEEYPYLASVHALTRMLIYVALPIKSEDDITLEHSGSAVNSINNNLK